MKSIFHKNSSDFWAPVLTKMLPLNQLFWYDSHHNTHLLSPNFVPLSSSIQFSHSVVSDSMSPHGLQHARLPYQLPFPTITNSRNLLKLMSIESAMPSNHLISVMPFSSHLQSFPASGSFPVSQFFKSDGQSIGVSALASVLPMNIQDWFPLGLICWISLQSKELSRVLTNTTVQKHQYFGAQLSF